MTPGDMMCLWRSIREMNKMMKLFVQVLKCRNVWLHVCVWCCVSDFMCVIHLDAYDIAFCAVTQ